MIQARTVERLWEECGGREVMPRDRCLAFARTLEAHLWVRARKLLTERNGPTLDPRARLLLEAVFQRQETRAQTDASVRRAEAG